MTDPLRIFCDGLSAKETDSILPFIAIITDPQGNITLDGSVSAALSVLILCIDGSATLSFESSDCNLKKGQYIYVDSHNHLRQVSFSDGFKGYISAKTIDFCYSLIERDLFAVCAFFNHPKSICLSNDQLNQNYHYFELMKCGIRRNPEDAEERIRRFISSAFWLFVDYKPENPEKISCRNNLITKQFFSILEEEKSVEAMSDEWFAERMKISKRSLVHAVSKATGQSPTEHLMRHKLKIAKRMIDEMSIYTTLQSIGEKLGFSTLASFSRFFKSQTGMTPKEYRNSMK